MKNVLLTTTALVALAGASSAAVSWGGDASTEYNSLTGFTYGANLSISATAELNNGVTAGMSWGASLVAPGTITGDKYPVIWIESSMGKFSAGFADTVGAASDHFSAATNSSDFVSYPTSAFALRADATFGGMNASISGIVNPGFTGITSTRAGVSGSFGAVSFGIGANRLGDFGVNVGTIVGGVDVSASYFTTGVLADMGVDVSYDMGNGVTLAGYYTQSNILANSFYGVSVDYASGPMGVSVAYTASTTPAASNITIDGTYDVSSDLTVKAGWDQGVGAYAGVDYSLGNGANIYASYSTGTAISIIGPDDYAGGITVGAAVTF